MRDSAHRRRIGLAIVVAGVAVIAAVVVLVAGDDEQVAAQPARLVLRDAATRQRRGCDHRPHFTIYTLGERFRGQDATRLADRCEAHADAVEVFYGPCREGGESGCVYDVSVRSQPVCLRPRELDLTFNGPPGGDLTGRRTVTVLRGVPAAIFDYTIVMMSRDTLITISADAGPARQAVDALRPADGATTLPKPDASVVAGRLRNRQCPA
jgi:hypothetical protein